jgi:hypothetical protein
MRVEWTTIEEIRDVVGEHHHRDQEARSLDFKTAL